MVRADYRELYDQADLMLRLDQEHWLKTGVEYVAGRRMLSAVVTRGFSDWSTVPAFETPDPLARSERLSHRCPLRRRHACYAKMIQIGKKMGGG